MLGFQRKSSEIEEKNADFLSFLAFIWICGYASKKGVNYNGTRQEIRRT